VVLSLRLRKVFMMEDLALAAVTPVGVLATPERAGVFLLGV
jgi:hypothetical protein